MDFGDLVFLIFIALGGLSSLLGAKKKKNSSPPAKRRPPTGDVARDDQGQSHGGDLQQARRKVSAEMDRILRELGLGGSVPPTEAPPAPSRPSQVEQSDAVTETARVSRPSPRSRPLPGRSFPKIVSLETYEREPVSLESLEGAGRASHERFHDRYIKPLKPPPDHSGRARGNRFVNPRSLREAMIVSEILGPPKGLE